MSKKHLKTQVLIIGGGATGTGLARDLALRGIKCILVEQRDINAGASGANHGLLHSGARYVVSDPDSARECREEAELLKKLATNCIEETGGLFVAVEGDDEKYIADFPSLCSNCEIPYKELDYKEVRELEPTLSEKVIAAFEVKDATIDPFMLSLENISQAQELGATLLRFTQTSEFKISNNHIDATVALNTQNGKETIIEAEQIVNASGAWAGEVANKAGAHISVLYSKGSLIVSTYRMTRRVINRLRKPSDGDILVPGGAVSILGTTSVRIDSLDQIYPTIEEVDLIVNEGAAMIPDLENTRYIRAYAGVRPLISQHAGGDEDRSVSRGFALIDHKQDGLDNFITISGGKLTTYRLMAEKTADIVSRRLGVSEPCKTRTEPLPSTDAGMWTEPGQGPRRWLEQAELRDSMLCECEMLPRSVIDRVIDAIHAQEGEPSLKGISLRSRMGKGPCQGTFCGWRVAGHLYERGDLVSDQGRSNLREFFRERWKGERPTLWGGQLIQAELKEAIYCGFLGLEL